MGLNPTFSASHMTLGRLLLHLSILIIKWRILIGSAFYLDWTLHSAVKQSCALGQSCPDCGCRARTCGWGLCPWQGRVSTLWGNSSAVSTSGSGVSKWSKKQLKEDATQIVREPKWL